MSPARRAARAGRNLLIALLVGAVVIVAIVVAYVASRPTSTPSVLPGTPTSIAAPSGSSSMASGAAPTGCLAGAARDSGMLLTAQKSAPRTTYGAVEVASAFFRWSFRSPHPTAEEVTSAAAIFDPGTAEQAQAMLIDDYKRNPNPAVGEVSSGTPFNLSTVNAKWSVNVLSAARVRVNIMAPLVIDGALSPTKTSTEAFDLKWLDGAWRVIGLAKADPSGLSAGGTVFTAGC